MRSIHLLAIDPQNDFCDPSGSLFVPGADEDTKRLAGFVTQAKDKLDDIHITMDSHNRVDISHAIWWKDSAGNHPNPYTVITAADVKAGTWITNRAWMADRSLAYLEALETGGRYPHVIWPYHCLIGSEGSLVYPELFAAVQDWTDRFAKPDFVAKGSNPWTEHFSAVRAEVPDPDVGWLGSRPFVVVSDGCSSSHNTDFGSRLLCLSAVREMGVFGSDNPVEMDGKTIMAGAVQMANALELPLTALDATVMLAWVEGPDIRVRVWGDGVVAARRRQGSRWFTTIEFASNAPAYLSYTWDEDRQVAYRRQTENGLHILYTTDQEDENPLPKREHREGLAPVEFSFPIEDFDLVVLLSDGIQTCHIPVEEAVDKVLAVKNYDGRFITRRVRRFLKQHRAAGCQVDDDLAVGVIYCPEQVSTALEETS